MSDAALDQLFQSALVHHRAGHLPLAEKLYWQILLTSPDHALSMQLLGRLSRQRGDVNAAIDLMRRATELQPLAAEYHCELGDAFRAKKLFAQAITSYRRAIELSPGLFDAHNNLGIALRKFGHLEESVAVHRAATELEPKNARGWNNLGVALSAMDEHYLAIDAYQRAIDLRPQYAQGFHNMGKALAVTDQFDLAIGFFRRATALKPDFAAAHGDLSNALKHEGKLEEALAEAERAVVINPLSPEAHCRLGLMLLRTGELERGWTEYEWRYRVSVPWNFLQPRWDGGELRGRTLLLHADQGLGDSVQFIRFAQLIAATGGRVLVRCQRQLVRLLDGFPGVEQVFSEDAALPEFDVHCPLISLPATFGTRVETIPSCGPYLRASPSLSRAWRARLDANDDRLKVGLVWAGHPSHSNDRLRSTRLGSFAPLSQVEGIVFYSLQVGPASAEASDPPEGMELIDLTAEIGDFADTAAMIEQLDLVIAVDTSTAHVAAAMGKPVWIVLPFVAEWRWLIDRTDTPWYPTMRLFRQPKLHDWQGAIEQMVEPLKRFV